MVVASAEGWVLMRGRLRRWINQLFMARKRGMQRRRWLTWLVVLCLALGVLQVARFWSGARRPVTVTVKTAANVTNGSGRVAAEDAAKIERPGRQALERRAAPHLAKELPRKYTVSEQGALPVKQHHVPLSGSLAVVEASTEWSAPTAALPGCLAVSTRNLTLQAVLPVYVATCPRRRPSALDDMLASAGSEAATAGGDYAYVEFWRNASVTVPQACALREAVGDRCLALDAATRQVVLNKTDDCLLFPCNRTAAEGTPPLDLGVWLKPRRPRQQTHRWTRWQAYCDRQRAELTPADRRPVTPLCAAFDAMAATPWEPQPLPLHVLHRRRGYTTASHALLPVAVPLVDPLIDIDESFRDRHLATVGMITVRRYRPLSQFTPEQLALADFALHRRLLPSFNGTDHTIRRAKPDDPRAQECLSVTDLRRRTVAYAACEKRHNDPYGQHQVWYTDGGRLYSVLSHELCVDAVNMSSLQPCPARYADCGAAYATMASLLLSLWREPMVRGRRAANLTHELIDRVHLFVGGTDADAEYLRAFSRNRHRIRLHRWDAEFAAHWRDLGAPPLSEVERCRHAAAATNYYAAIRRLHEHSDRHRHLILIEDDVKVADDAWRNQMASLMALERTRERQVMMDPRGYRFVGDAKRTAYFMQLYVPLNWHEPDRGWRYGWLRKENIFGTQAILFGADAREALLLHYRQAMTRARSAASIPKYDIHLHSLWQLESYGLARSSFEHMGCASTGLGDGRHRSHTWTADDGGVNAVRSAPTEAVPIWRYGKVAPVEGTGPDTADAVRIVQLHDAVARPDGSRSAATAAVPAAARYATLASLLAAAWADGAPMLDRIERIEVFGFAADSIRHHRLVHVCADPPKWFRAGAMPVVGGCAGLSDGLTVVVRHRPERRDMALGFPDGWFAAVSATVAQAYNQSAIHAVPATEDETVRVIGLPAAESDYVGLPSRSQAGHGHFRVVDAASACDRYAVLVLSSRHHGWQALLRRRRVRRSVRSFAQLCRALTTELRVPVLEPDADTLLQLMPRLEPI